jgi:hypothetical protein
MILELTVFAMVVGPYAASVLGFVLIWRHYHA